MKHLILFISICIVLFSCVSSKTNLEKGNYDEAIEQSIKKIQRKHEVQDVIVLEEAYRNANEKDILEGKINLVKIF